MWSRVVNVGQGWWREKVCGRGGTQRRGGEASPPNYAKGFYTIIQHALLPLAEVRRIDVRSTAADLDRGRKQHTRIPGFLGVWWDLGSVCMMWVW